MLRALALALCVAVPFSVSGKGGSRSSTSHSSASRTSSHGGKKNEHVGGYYRKDAKYVAPYDRRPAGTADHSSRSGSGSHKAVGPAAHPRSHTSSASHNHGKRDPKAKAAFRKTHPCPSTGKTSGACPGYVVDHVTALKHGGADDPSNMQWQTTAAAKAKDKWE